MTEPVQHSTACLSVGGGPNDDDCICGANQAAKVTPVLSEEEIARLVHGMCLTWHGPEYAVLKLAGEGNDRPGLSQTDRDQLQHKMRAIVTRNFLPLLAQQRSTT